MFCFQCEQTSKGSGCTVAGVCGKKEETADLQDLLVHTAKGIAMYAHRAAVLGKRDPGIDVFVIEALFSTVTNVNFDPQRLAELLRKSGGILRKARSLYENACVESGDAQKGLANLARVTDDLSSTTSVLPETVARMNSTLRRVDRAMSRQERDVDEILDNLRRVTGDLAELVREAKRHPSWTLFGNPPPPLELDKK